MQSEVAMYAAVGDGEILMEYNDDMACYLIKDGTMEDLAVYYGGDAGMMRILVGILFIVPMGCILLLFSIVFAVSGVVSKRKAEKKKAEREKNKRA